MSTTSSVAANTNNLFARRYDSDGESRLSGWIDDLQIYNWALDADVIEMLYKHPGITTEDLLPGDANLDGRVDGSGVTILANNWQYGTTSAANAVPEPSTTALLITVTTCYCLLFACHGKTTERRSLIISHQQSR